MSADVAAQAEQLVFEAAHVASRELTLAAKDVTHINERDYLQPVLKAALEEVSARYDTGPTVLAARDHGISAAWLRANYASGFRRWERDGYRPIRVPRRFATRAVGRTEFSVAGDRWLIGVSRVEPFGAETLLWEPFIAAG